MRKKKSPSSKCSAGSEDSGLGLKVRMIQLPRGNNPGFNKEVKAIPSLSQSTWEHNNLLVSGQTTTTNTPAKSTGKDLEIVEDFYKARKARRYKKVAPKLRSDRTGLMVAPTIRTEHHNTADVHFVSNGIKPQSFAKEISETSKLAQYLSMIFLQRDFPVRLFPLRENATVFKTKQGELFSMKYAELLEVKGRVTYSLRMLKDYFLTTEVAPSRLYSFRWMSLGMMSNGKCLTLSIGYPRTVKGSLSSVLEEKIDEKYYLSNAMKKYIENKTHHKVPLSRPKEDLKSPIRGQGDKPMTGDAIGLKQVGNIDKKGHNSLWGRVYSPEGLASNINAEGGGLGAKTGLYLANTVDTDGYLRRGTRDRDKNGKAILTSIPKRRIRRLTPRECERLQGFPDDWTRVPAIGNDVGIEIASHPEDEDEIIRGKIMSDTQRYKMMGNAVSVPVIEAIGRKILECIA